MKKKLALMFTAMLLVCVIAVGATIAYLTHTPDPITNVFTVGNIGLSADEADTNEYGQIYQYDEDGNLIIDEETGKPIVIVDEEGNPVTVVPEDWHGPRDQNNEYTLIPGNTYIKDPTVHVEVESEPCYLFIKVVNGLDGFEDNPTIVAQMQANGWNIIEEKVREVVIPNEEDPDNPIRINLKEYYCCYREVVNAKDEAKNIPVFSTVTIRSDAVFDQDPVPSYKYNIGIASCAIQSMGFENATEAYAKLPTDFMTSTPEQLPAE